MSSEPTRTTAVFSWASAGHTSPESPMSSGTSASIVLKTVRRCLDCSRSMPSAGTTGSVGCGSTAR